MKGKRPRRADGRREGSKHTGKGQRHVDPPSGAPATNTLGAGIRAAGSYLAGFVAALACFGLLLTVTWWLPFKSVDFRLAGAVLASSVSLVVGGFVAGLIGREEEIINGGMLGFVCGLVGFGAALGARWPVLLFALSAGPIGAIGGRLAALYSGRKTAGRPSTKKNRAGRGSRRRR